MNQFETKFVYGNELFKTHCKKWLRYIDDVFALWAGPYWTLERFVQEINNSLPFIKFSLNAHLEEIPFLDTRVYKQGGCLMTDLYVKSTDRNLLLHYRSFHPPQLKRALSKSQLSRVKRIVASSEIADKRLTEMCNKFREREYPDNLLNRQLEEIKSQERSEMLKGNEKNRENHVTFVTQYNTLSKQVANILRRHWPLLYKKGRSLGSMLVHSDIGRNSKQKNMEIRGKVGSYPCLNCNCCSNVQVGENVFHPRKGNPIKIRGRYSCGSTYAVYVIKCPCGLAYVGQTKRTVRERIHEHKSAIKTGKKDQTVAGHFIEHAQSVKISDYRDH
ncbi:hypothetical protein XELAEV_18007939mg [Xenopus laevis]|uniref:GIY-YIG domain-containing protein n=1 Tax=Xenopus laevis TaxID=8355 RepID=A0A974E3T4_XENLA|nr:hypothetical protein XELAEV_18007939mg [Xenopus laevis]